MNALRHAAQLSVEVRGHASPAETPRNQSKARQLSFDRAMAVAHALAARGVRWEQMRVVACGDTERVVARSYDREQDRANQRVEVIMTRDVVPTDPYTREINRAAGAGKREPESNPGAGQPRGDKAEPGPESADGEKPPAADHGGSRH